MKAELAIAVAVVAGLRPGIDRVVIRFPSLERLCGPVVPSLDVEWIQTSANLVA